MKYIGQSITAVLWEFIGSTGTLEAVLRGDLPHYELKHIHRELPDGEVAYLTFQLSAVSPFEPQKGLLLLVEDTTEIGRIQQTLSQERNQLRLAQNELAETNRLLQQTNDLKNYFLEMAAHDMRTPLATVIGYASLLRDHPNFDTNPQQHEILSTIIDQSERLNQLIGDLITVDKIDQGQLKLHRKQIDVSKVLAEIVAALTILAGKKHISLALKLEADPLYAEVDPKRFWQVAYNLIGNSIKYTPSKGVVQIRAYLKQAHFVLEVTDNGQGMTPVEVQNLFRAYYRTKKAAKSKTPGEGLGLFIVKTLVDAHGGRIDVSSRPGQGSTFTVTLPQTDPEDN